MLTNAPKKRRSSLELPYAQRTSCAYELTGQDTKRPFQKDCYARLKIRKTPEPFIAACNRFIFFEVLKNEPDGEAVATPQVDGLPDLKSLLTHAIQETSRDGGWAMLAAVGQFISKNNASFDARNYGYKRLSDLVRQQGYLDHKVVPEANGVGQHLHVRLKVQEGRAGKA